MRSRFDTTDAPWGEFGGRVAYGDVFERSAATVAQERGLLLEPPDEA